jgi:hypothetical protein
MYTGFWSEIQNEETLGRRTCTWEYNIKIDVREIGRGWHGLDSSGSA